MADFGKILKFVGIGLFFVGSVFTGGVLSAVLIGSGLVLGQIGSALEKEPVLQQRQSTIRSRRDPGAAVPVVYGQAKTGSIVADTVVDEGTNNESVLYMPTVLCHGSRDGFGIAGVEEVYLDGTLAFYKWAGFAWTFNVDSQFSDQTVGYELFTGTTAQNIGNTSIGGLGTLAAKALSAFDAWSATTDEGAGLAAIAFRFRQRLDTSDPDSSAKAAFPRGAPDVTTVLKGNFVEDTRSEVSGVNITFGDDDPDTITRASGSFVTDGWVVGDRVNVTGSSNNDTDPDDATTAYTVADVDVGGLILTLKSTDTVTAEGPAAGITLKRWAHPDNAGDNPAMCIRDYLLSGIYGPGYASTLIDDTSFEAAADFCDVLISSPSGNQKRFTCNGILDTNRPIESNLNELLSSCRGNLVWEGGTFKLFIRQSQSVNTDVELTEDNIIGEWTFRSAGIEDRWNLVRANYVNPEKDYNLAETQWPRAVTVPNPYLNNDNDFLNELELDFPFTNDQHMAQQICQVILNESRQGISASVRCTEEALQLAVGDTVNVTKILDPPTPLWDQKPFWVAALQLLADSSVLVSLQEYDAAAYSLSTIDDKDTEPDTLLGDLFTVPPVTSVQLSSGVQSDLVTITWTAADYAFVDYYEVQARHRAATGGDDTYRTVARVRGNEATNEAVAHGARTGQVWQARVRTVNTISRASAWVESASHTVQIHDQPQVSIALTAVSDGVLIEVDDFDVDGDGIDAYRVELYVRENSGASGSNPYEVIQYHVNTFYPGDGSFLEPAGEDRYVRCFAVAYNQWGERGYATAVAEAQSGAVGAGPTAPPNTLAEASVQVEQFGLTWVNADGTAQTWITIDGTHYSTENAGVNSKTITGRVSNTLYTVGIAHFKFGIFNPLEGGFVEIEVTTQQGTLGTPQNLAAATVDPYRVKLTWDVGTDGDEASHVVERSDTGAFGGEEEQIATPGAGVTEYTHSDSDEGDNTWYFRVKAQRTNWTDSAWTSSVQGTYGHPPQLDAADFAITYTACNGGLCGQTEDCSDLGNRHLIYWAHSGGDDLIHHIEVWRDIDDAGFVKQVDSLSVNEAPDCGSIGKTMDGGYAFMYLDCDGPDTGSGNDYQYRIDLRLTVGGTLVDQIFTTTKDYNPATTGCTG